MSKGNAIKETKNGKNPSKKRNRPSGKKPVKAERKHARNTPAQYAAGGQKQSKTISDNVIVSSTNGRTFVSF